MVTSNENREQAQLYGHATNDTFNINQIFDLSNLLSNIIHF